MSELDVQIPTTFDPFAEANAEDSGAGSSKDYVHVRIQQRNGRKSDNSVIQLQGDQRKNVSTFLVTAGIVKKEHIKIHGF
ncbi:hypothetical protein ACHQM5_015820 [Ranunculus cassubicifolius]